MKITNGTKTYDVSNWDSVKIENYLSKGWTKDGKSSGYSKKKDVKQAYEEAVEEIVSEEPTQLEESEDGGN